MKKGVYALFIELDRKQTIEIGALGEYDFESGIYVYVGSAMNGLNSRIQRHRSNEKKTHWHIDYFLKNSEVIGDLKIETEKDFECDLNQQIKKLALGTPVKNFGSSDCNCKAHFHVMHKY